jgi:mono/diheme cytochrome c family protein
MTCRPVAKIPARHAVTPWLTALLFLTILPAQAKSPGDLTAGRRLADIWCANCHVVAPEPRHEAGNPTPTFSTIAHRKSLTPWYLHRFLLKPHGGMPDLHLKPDETDDLIAYIVSLRRP